MAGAGASVVEVEASVLAVDAEEGSSRRRSVDIVAELLDCVGKKIGGQDLESEGIGIEGPPQRR